MLNRSVIRMNGTNTKRVQAVIPNKTVDRLIKAASKRKMSVSGFIGAAIEKQLNEVEKEAA